MDGLWAAFAARLAHPDTELIPAAYGRKPDLSIAPGEKIYLLDLTYPRTVIEEWADRGADIQIIDHHKTALQDLSGLSARILQTFDMQKSGAVLAWEHFHPGQPVPLIFRYVQDRDIWTKRLPDCDLIALGLSETMRGLSLDNAIVMCDVIYHEINNIADLTEIGRIANVEIKAAIAHAVATHTQRIINGDLVPFFRCRKPREFQAYSDIGHAILKANPDAPFACVEAGAGWAMRSDKDRADVSVIAKTLGGGGHRDASGCQSDNMLSIWFKSRD
jgi:uncharacterized protein